METVYMYQIKTPTGLVVKIGKTEHNAEARMHDYANEYGLDVDFNSLVTVDVENSMSAESQLQAIFEASGFRNIQDIPLSPKELFQSNYIRTYQEAVHIFKSKDVADTANIERDNTKKWKSSDLTSSKIADRPLKINRDDCHLMRIVVPNKDTKLATGIVNNARYKKLNNAFNKPNMDSMHLLTFKHICDKKNLALVDANNKLFNFKPHMDWEVKYLSRTGRLQKKWPQWKREANAAIEDFFRGDGFNDITKSKAHEHVYFAAKVLLQRGYHLIDVQLLT